MARDAEQENSIYIPEQLLREHGSAHATILAPDRARETRARARRDDRSWRGAIWIEAKAYLLAIPRRAVSIRLFCALPLLFAYATLRDLARSSDAPGRRAVVKISRSEVKSLTVVECRWSAEQSCDGAGWSSGRGESRCWLFSAEATRTVVGGIAVAAATIAPSSDSGPRRPYSRALELIEQLLERQLCPSHDPPLICARARRYRLPERSTRAPRQRPRSRP